MADTREQHLPNEQKNGDQRSRVRDVGTAVTNVLTYILLDRFEYAHVRDKNTGDVRLEVGEEKRGKRLQLNSHEEHLGTWEKVRVQDGQFAIVRNPFDPARDDITPGDRDVRPGPTEFPLHPGEELEGIHDEHVLADDEGLLLRAEKDAPHPLAGVGDLDPDAVLRAGEELLLRGERRYIPHKYIRVKDHRKALSLAADAGKYVQNNDTGVVRLVRGECDLFLEHNESLWAKRLTREEREALGYEVQQTPNGSRVLAAEPHPRREDSDAVVIDLESNEALCVYAGNSERVILGSDRVFLGPYDRPKVLQISGGVPVKPNALRIAKLKLGPDFIRDQLNVRTKDNATLTVEVTYRWRFAIDAEHREKLFALKDFVGFASQTLSSEIREEAAKHDFEVFHAQAAELVKRAIFGDRAERTFTENGLIIFGVDVEGITPEDPEIKKKLSDAIKTNVDIYTKRVQEVATLESEGRIIEGKAKNEEARKQLIGLEAENAKMRELAAATRAGEAKVIVARGEADAITIHANAEREAENARLQALTKILETAGGKLYIDLERARVFKATDKIVVPTDSKLVLGMDRLIDAGE